MSATVPSGGPPVQGQVATRLHLPERRARTCFAVDCERPGGHAG